jgi:carbonic anhydrase
MSAMQWEPSGTADHGDEGRDAVEALFEQRPAPAPVVRRERDPARRLIVVSCMDARIDVMPALGLHPGDAHIIRNAGAIISDDVLRSIEVSRTQMHTDRVLIVGHSGCAAYETLDETRAALREALMKVPGRAAAALYHLEAGKLEPVS